MKLTRLFLILAVLSGLTVEGVKRRPMSFLVFFDGAAEHFVGFHGGYDALKIWSRPLAPLEIDTFFRRGR